MIILKYVFIYSVYNLLWITFYEEILACLFNWRQTEDLCSRAFINNDDKLQV